MPSVDSLVTTSLWQRLQRLSPYFTVRPFVWWLAIAATTIGGGMEFIIAQILKYILDDGFGDPNFNPWIIPVLLIGFGTIRSLMAFLGDVGLTYVSNDGMLKLRQELFSHLLQADLSLLGTYNASSLANTIVYEVQNGMQMLVQTILGVVRSSAMVLGLVGYLLWLNWRLTLIVLVIFPLVGWVARVVSKRLYRITQAGQTATDELAYVVEENVLAKHVVRLHAAQQQQSKRFLQKSRGLRRLGIKGAVAGALAQPISHFFIICALSGVITVALYQNRGEGFSVGSFAAFITAMLIILDPMRRLSRALTPLTRGIAALERGLNFMRDMPLENSGKQNPGSVRGEITLSGVGLHYGEQPILQDIDLHIQAGEVLALVGASGSGKTSLVNLLPRFIQPGSGQVALDGVPLPDWDLHALRSHIALVSQDVVLFNSSLAENIALGQTLNENKVRACLEAANLGQWLASLPNGVHTQVGHNAQQLSGGQRQRVAIARALYKDVRILLLDEATSALDSKSERLVQEALRRLLRGRTTLIVAHRLSTIEHADRIVVLEQGRIVEIGNHSALLQNQERYAELYRYQHLPGNPYPDHVSNTQSLANDPARRY